VRLTEGTNKRLIGGASRLLNLAYHRVQVSLAVATFDLRNIPQPRLSMPDNSGNRSDVKLGRDVIIYNSSTFMVVDWRGHEDRLVREIQKGALVGRNCKVSSHTSS